jgi:cystathionine gamma-synthase
MHSGTKGIAGHSDALLGLVTASPLTEKGKILGPLLRQVQIAVGGVASSLDSWLALRGIRTLAVRVERQSNTAMEVAKFLEQNPLVKEVHYPGLQSHPQHEIAKLQMSGGFGSVLSLEMEDEVVATALAAALTTIQRATSLGGTETLIEHRSSIEPPDRTTSPPGLLRLSIGLEDAKDLISDLDRALLIAKEVAS